MVRPEGGESYGEAVDRGELAPNTETLRGVDFPSARNRCVLTILLLTLLPAGLLSNLWDAGGVAAVGDDLIYYLPVRAYIGEQLRAGHLPLWNPYVSMGTPLAADPQAGLWYPFTWLFVALPPLLAYCISLWLHYVIAGWGMYRFLRALRRAWPAALLGAVAFEFCPYLIAHREHLTIHHAVAWIPWIFFAWERYASERRASRIEIGNKRASAGHGLQPPVSARKSNPAGQRFAILGCAFWGLQLLVQHIQPSIMTALLLGAYVLFLLRPRRPGIVPIWCAAMVGGGLLAAVQLMPTFYLFASSGRSTPAYYLFLENTWVLTSALTFLFPMIFGNSTPNLWSERWWGMSHLSEQWVYPTLVVLTLAISSLGLLTSRQNVPENSAQSDRERCAQSRNRREVIFWWAACAIALLIALGDITPLGKVLFHVPVYRSLRVPARWSLVWSIAWPVLASLSLNVLLRGGVAASGFRRSVERTASRIVPGLFLLSLVFMGLGHTWARRILERMHNREAAEMLARLADSVRRPDPAVLWPMVLGGVSVLLIMRFARRPSKRAFGWLLGVLVVDLAGVVPFVAVDDRTYRAGDIFRPVALSAEIKAHDPRSGERLLVPRLESSYDRPLEVLWPQSNVCQKIATLNGYGPLWDSSSRFLFRFMAWGSSQNIIDTLRNSALLQRMGVRFIAVRTAEERSVLAAAMLPAEKDVIWQQLAAESHPVDVPWQSGLLWRARVDRPGLYQLDLSVEPVAGSPSRWFVRLESTDHEKDLAPTHTVEPADLAGGARTMRFLFHCRKGEGDALIRIKSEMGVAVRAKQARFGLIASDSPSSTRLAQGASAPVAPYFHLGDLLGGVSLFELKEARPLVWLPQRIVSMPDPMESLDWLLGEAGQTAGPDTAVVHGAGGIRELAPVACDFRILSPEQVEAIVEAAGDQLVVFNTSRNQGWTATVDGIPGGLESVNGAAQGVWVKPGRHMVHFSYSQPGLRAGGILSLVALLALISCTLQTTRVSGRTI